LGWNPKNLEDDEWKHLNTMWLKGCIGKDWYHAVEVKPHPLGEEKYVLQGKTIHGWITFRVQIYTVYQQDVVDSLACLGVKSNDPENCNAANSSILAKNSMLLRFQPAKIPPWSFKKLKLA
jgi:hypothetical protein